MANQRATARTQAAKAQATKKTRTPDDRPARRRREPTAEQLGERPPVNPRISARATAATARAERDADPELRELSDEAIDRADDPHGEDDLIVAARGVLGPPDGAVDERAPDDETSPELAGGDVDAAVTDTGSGEEAVSGTNPTPDQDSVEEQAAALGVTYQPDEPLHTTEKIARRDDDRWELNPASSEDFGERRNLEHALPERTPRRGR